MNARISAKERNLIKGAIRRVFSRSELRAAVVHATQVEYFDPNRPRVKKWSRCQKCNGLTPTYQIEVDHIDPIIPLDKTLEEMTWDTVIDRVWCERTGLWGLCDSCHNEKTKAENKQRRKTPRKRRA